MSANPRPGDGLRPMQTGDLDAVMALEVARYSFPWSRGNFIDSLAAGYRARVWTEADGTIAGYCLALPGAGEMHLLNLTVAAPLQGRGLARAMLDDLVRAARARHDADLWLEVRATNDRARTLYLRYGFETVGIRRGYYPAAHGQREDAIVMRMALNPAGGSDAAP